MTPCVDTERAHDSGSVIIHCIADCCQHQYWGGGMISSSPNIIFCVSNTLYVVNSLLYDVSSTLYDVSSMLHC